MSKKNFTAPRVLAFECEEGKAQSFFWDADTDGLGVRVTASGAKSYIHQAKLDGKSIRTTIGDTRAWALDDAKKKARELQIDIDNGKDPRLVKESRIKAKLEQQASRERAEVTLGDVWPVYIAARKHRWSDLSLRDHLRAVQLAGEPHRRTKGETVAAPLVSLLDCRLIDLSADRIKTWLDAETATRPSSAARCFRLLRGCLNWCGEDGSPYIGLAPVDAHSAKRVREAVPSNGTKSDCLQKEMLPAWFAAVKMQSNVVVSAYLQTLLLTGARTGELINLKWDDVDFQWLTLTIGDKVAKHGKSATEKLDATRTIPLTPYVASLLIGLPRRNEFVFSSPKSATGKMTDPNTALTCAVQTAGLPHLTVHGLRRSFGTLAEWTEAPVGVVAQIEGRKPTAIAEKHYRRRPIDLLRMWHVKIEAWILEQAGINFQANAAPAVLRVVA
ncbi:integrase family protein [Deefgea tanakiae]|uniref:Integrase family protein n=1 Tax=Deefgea tanakiae TaxID=2865840 RepID=A0ABX8ZAN0_9NEIS|nr:integrase family protein [Deefgea tanakiae]QZA78188.1 integrase family protein [Deefgea tanakiae]